MVILTSLPLELKHHIFVELLPKTYKMNLSWPKESPSITSCLAPLAQSGKSIREEVISWYNGVKAILNYVHTPEFGAIRPDHVVFQMLVNSQGAEADGEACICQLEGRLDLCVHRFCTSGALSQLRRSWSGKSYESVCRVQLSMVGHIRNNDMQSDCDARVILAVVDNLKQLRDLDIYMYREINGTMKERMSRTYTNPSFSPNPIAIPIGEQNILCIDRQKASLLNVRLWITPTKGTDTITHSWMITEHAQLWKEWYVQMNKQSPNLTTLF